MFIYYWKQLQLPSDESRMGSFDRSTKHPNLENGAPKTRKRSTLDRKRRPLNLENEAPQIENEAPKSRKRSTQNSKTKHPRSKTKHPKLENEDPKTRKRSTQKPKNFGVCGRLQKQGANSSILPKIKMQNVGSIVVLILVWMGSGITASIPVQNDERFPFHSSLKAICKLVQLRVDRWHKKHISRLRPTGRLLNSLTLPFFICSIYFKILLFPNIEPGPRLLPYTRTKFCLDLICSDHAVSQISNMLDCKTIVFFLKISKEVGKVWRKSNRREPHTPFSVSFQTFRVTAHAYLNTPKSADGRF